MYKYDLHVHSSPASACAKDSAADLVKKYKQSGFAGIVLTNHFRHGNTGVSRSLSWQEFVKEYAKDYYDALKTAKELDFDLLFGIEEGYGEGKEFLVYGISPEVLAENPQLQAKSIEAWSKAVRKNGGFIAYAHPFRDRFYIPEPRKMPDISLVDGIEGYNCANSPEENNLAFNTFKESGKTIIAGGDKHEITFNKTFGIMTSQRIKTEAQLVKILKANDFTLYLGE